MNPTEKIIMEMLPAESTMLLQKCLVVLICGSLLWMIIRYMCSLLKVEKEPVIVLVTGAAGMLNLVSSILA